jgi:gluconolactonase
MKTAWLGLATLTFVWACGGDNGTGTPANTAGTGNGGGPTAGTGNAGSPAAGTSNGGGPTAGTGNGGSGNGGSTPTAGAGASTGGSAGTGGAAGGSGGGAGGSMGGAAQGFACPAGPYEAPAFGTPTRVDGVPPADAFNNMNNDFTNIEGAVWAGGALYVSEIGSQGAPPPSRIIKVAADGAVSIAVPDSGTNGLAVNAAGELFGAKHTDGSVSKIALPAGTATPVASMFMGARFNSPNDLTFHTNGTLYFTDPSYQAPMPTPQMATRAYIVKPGGMPQAIEGNLTQPNGITLSKNQDFLYIGGNQLKKYPVMADGSLGASTDFVAGGGSDGMVIDCADNLYITKDGVQVYDKNGQKIGATLSIGAGQPTNVAFGGADHKTLYVTAMGSGMQKGLYKVPMNVPGYPY